MQEDKHKFLINDEEISFEIGNMAKSANGSVLLRYRDNVLLITATMSNPRPGIDFFPLIVDFEEKLYARGKIPGGFFRREGRPSSSAILSARLIDRTLRPLFPESFRHEVAIVILPLAVDLTTPLDWLGLIGANLALSISDIPFNGPVSATNIGYINDDPIISTIGAVYAPFPLVALIFPSAIRHIQRCRMHVIFVPAMFLSVRFPWFLIMVTLLFWILRYYNYFRFGEVKPSFKVDLPITKDS